MLSLKIRHITYLLSLALWACSSDTPDGVIPANLKTEEGTALELNISLGLASASNGSRATTESYCDGTDFERTINNLTVFLCDLDAEGSVAVKDGAPAIVWTRILRSVPTMPWISTSQYNKLASQAKFYNVTPGTKRVYIGANLNQEMIDAFVAQGPEAIYNLPVGDINIGQTLADASTGMAFFCTEAQDIVVADNTHEAIDMHEFSLKRMAAKVLVTACTYGETEYVKSSSSFRVKLSDVYYTVNTINNYTYLLQQASDPNWNALAPDDFNYHPMVSWVNYGQYFEACPRYYEAKLPSSGNSDVYSEGIYVPENSYNYSALYSAANSAANSAEDALELAEQNVTHVIVRAKLTPTVFYLPYEIVEYMSGTTYYDKLASEAASAINITTYAGEQVYYDDAKPVRIFLHTCEDNDENEAKLLMQADLDRMAYYGISGESFYYDAADNFYSYGAAAALGMNYNDPSEEGKLDMNYTDARGQVQTLRLFVDGISTYRTFLSNTDQEDFDKDDWSDGCVNRDTYYILHISMVNSPGFGINPNQIFIDTHASKIEYANSWNANVDITD